MITKVIQKEKKRQDGYINGCGEKTRDECVRWYKSEVEDVEVFINICGEKDFRCESCCYKSSSHNESLISLKEDREKLVDRLEDVWKEDSLGYLIDELKEDIQELNKMIERYK